MRSKPLQKYYKWCNTIIVPCRHGIKNSKVHIESITDIYQIKSLYRQQLFDYKLLTFWFSIDCFLMIEHSEEKTSICNTNFWKETYYIQPVIILHHNE